MRAVVRPIPGPGILARAGDLLLVCADTGRTDGAGGVDELLTVVEEVAADGGDGGTLVRRVAALLAADFTGRFPACAASGPAAEGRVAVLVYGSATADISGGDGQLSLSGADAITSVNRMIAGPVTSLRLVVPGAASEDPRLRLDAGVVVAAGAVYGEPGAASGYTDVGAAAGAWAPAEPVHAPIPEPAAQPILVPPLEPAAAPALIPPAAFSSPASFAPSFAEAADALAPDAVAADVATPDVAAPDAPDVAAAEAAGSAAALADVATLGPNRMVEPLPKRPVPVAPPDPPPLPMPDPAPAPLPPAGGPQSPPLAPIEAPGPGRAPKLRQPDASAAFVSVLLGPEAGGPDPAEGPVGPSDRRPRILGVLCQNDHFNDPGLRYCATCGVAMAHRPAAQVEGARPPLGVLVLDDGSTYRLDLDYVIGREPHQDPEVVDGRIRPLRVVDSEGVVSRRHARVALNGWDVQIIDLGSANGTFVQLPGDPQRHQLAANEPVSIRPGTQVTMGRRWFRFESHRNP
jgi:hypothetical protein